MRYSQFPVVKNRKLKIGLVGCGRISKNHLSSILKYQGDLELTAVCDVDPVALSKTTADYGVRGYSRFEEMLANECLDLVTLSTPSGLHKSQTLLAAKHGVNVISEKPMATSYEDGLQMVDTCDNAGVRLFVVKQNRHNATLKLLKRAINEKRFGDIKLVHVNVFWTRPQEYYDAGNGWRGTWEYDGGAFMNQASHYVDLIEWLIGPVERVQAMTSTTRAIEAEDTGVVNIKWRNGALGSMAVSMLTFPKNLEGSITIIGDTGTVKIGGVAVNEIQTWEFSDHRDYDSDVKAASYDTTSVYGFGHQIYYENIVNVMRGLEDPATDGREGIKSLELIAAIYKAANILNNVPLPLKHS